VCDGFAERAAASKQFVDVDNDTLDLANVEALILLATSLRDRALDVKYCPEEFFEDASGGDWPIVAEIEKEPNQIMTKKRWRSIRAADTKMNRCSLLAN
jgi:hypothetical protein